MFRSRQFPSKLQPIVAKRRCGLVQITKRMAAFMTSPVGNIGRSYCV